MTFVCIVFLLPSFLIFFLVGLGLNSGLHTCKAGTVPLKPHLHSVLLWLFWRQGP
jgi:hypothetical protein